MAEKISRRLMGYMAALDRRAEWLESRIKSSDVKLTYDEHELKAIRWAIQLIKNSWEV